MFYPSLNPHHKMCGGGGYDGFALSRLSVGLHYRVRSINPIPIQGFSSNLAEMFTSTRGCAEPMLHICQLKVKVTIECKILNNQILDIMPCPLFKSYTNGKIFFNLGSNVHLNNGDVQSRCYPFAGLRSHLKVKN